MTTLQYIDTVTTPYPAEVIDGVAVTQVRVMKVSGTLFTPVLQIIRDVLPGDILTIVAGCQATNNLHKSPFNAADNNVSLGRFLAYIHPVTLAMTPITLARGSNLDARQHHGPRDDAAIWKVPAGVSGPTKIRMYLHSAAEQARSSWYLRLDQGYGHMHIKHERPV